VQLGLRYDADAQVPSGTRYGHFVTCRGGKPHRFDVYDGGVVVDRAVVSMNVVAYIAPLLDVGFGVGMAPSIAAGRLGPLYDPRQIALFSPPLTQAVASLLSLGGMPLIGDGGVSVAHFRPDDSAFVATLIERVAYVASCMDDARTLLPVREELAFLVPAFDAVRDELGLTPLTCPLGLVGVVAGCPVEAVMHKASNGDHELHIGCGFSRAPDIGVDIRSYTPRFLMRLFPKKDDHLGDARLDARLEIHAGDIAVLRDRLGESERADLGLLVDAGRLHIDRAGVQLDGANPDRLAELIGAAARVANAIVGLAPHDAAGPYR